MPQYVACASVCLSVRLSVTFTYRDHIGWNSLQIISRLISLRFMLALTSTWAIWSNGNTPKLWWNGGGVMSTKPAISLKRCKIDPGYYDGLIGSRKSYFDWCKNRWPWMTLNGRNALLRKKSFYGAHQKEMNEDRFILSAAKYRSMTLVSRNIRYMQ